MLEFWEDALPNLPQAAKEVHARVGVFYNNKTEILPKDAIYELGVVSYPGKGKYHECNSYIPFHELPDSEGTASEEESKMRSPEKQGWWPVIALQKVAEKTKDGATKRKSLLCAGISFLRMAAKFAGGSISDELSLCLWCAWCFHRAASA